MMARRRRYGRCHSCSLLLEEYLPICWKHVAGGWFPGHCSAQARYMQRWPSRLYSRWGESALSASTSKPLGTEYHSLMRRVLLIAVVATVLSAGSLLEAQVRSNGSGTVVNSSCCAIGMFGPSVPAGSIGVQSGISGGAPHAFPVGREFRHDGVRRGGEHRFHNRQFGNSGYPIYYAPYAYGYYDETTNVDANPPASANYEQPVNDEGPGLTVFERRRTYELIGDKPQRASADGRYGEHYTDSREERGASDDREQKSSPSESEKAPEPTVPTILIFRDGSHREIHNYALMGNSIYDLSVKPGQGRMKILLADLDIPATIAANDQRGIEFKLPKQ